MNSVSQLIEQLNHKTGEDFAFQQLFERYWNQLVRLARRRLGDAPKRIGDEDDLANSVFHSLWRGAAAGRFQNVRNRDHLWWLLMAITRKKVVDHIRRETAQKRGGGRHEEADSDEASAVERAESRELSPDYMVALQEEYERLLSVLRDALLRSVAIDRMEGYTNEEIAIRHEVSTRTVERKLELIRDVWKKDWKRELNDDACGATRRP